MSINKGKDWKKGYNCGKICRIFKKEKEMRRIEDLLADKIYEATNIILQKFIKPDFSYESVTELSMKQIEDIKFAFGIEGVIIDVDDTLRKDMQMIPECNKKWLEDVRKHLKVIVVSNGVDGKVEEYLKSKGIDYIGFAMKPLRRGFKKACDRMGLEPEKVLVIGDQLIDDIYGGRRCGMMTIKVSGSESKKKKEKPDEVR